jgi:hypothetical protein
MVEKGYAVHATIQKPLDEILAMIGEGEKVFVIGCNNCAAKCHSGGEPETEEMARRLRANGVEVTGWGLPEESKGTCVLSLVKEILGVQHKEEAEAADSFLVLACGQGVHTVIDATEGGLVHPGCDTIFGGETVSPEFITEYCSLCGECIADRTGGLCPLTLCAKALLNGPCGGASNGKCEVFEERDCGWQLIYERLKQLGRTESMYEYVPPKSNLKSTRPRSIRLSPGRAEFTFASTTHTVPAEETAEEQGGAQ